MKYVLAGIFSIFFLFSIGLAAEKPELKDRKERESYSLGFQFGKNMQYPGKTLFSLLNFHSVLYSTFI